MFKKFLHDETAIIGLKSLGLSTPKQTPPAKKEIQQNLTMFSSSKTSNYHSSINNNAIPQEEKSLESLFGRSLKLNLNK